jgi:hypothetical protein
MGVDLSGDDAFNDAFDQREAERIQSAMSLQAINAMRDTERRRVEVLVRTTGKPDGIMTPEGERKGDYADVFVMHVETMTVANAKRNRQASSLARMLNDSQLTEDQYGAALRIADVAESIGRAVSVRSASLEARVDNSGSARDIIVEHLMQVRIQVVYTRWRNLIPIPRRMILDMIVTDRALKATARAYRFGWPKAKRMLINSLDLWLELEERVARDVDDRDVEAIYNRLANSPT